MSVSIGMGLISAFILGSISYVYKFRGSERYEKFSEYLRKGWPVFTPLNCLLYMFTKERASKSIMTISDFPELKVIEDNWEVIAQEATELYKNGFFESTTQSGADSYYDLGFRTFYKYGWSKFYLNWYGYTHASALKHCPKTSEVLKNVKSVNGAMFSLLPVGSKLTRHLDPVACSLRYQLGLNTPNDDRCFINVDGQNYSWRDGEAFMFDETYLHFANNNSETYRLILMCDVERPMNFLGKTIQFFYKGTMRSTVVPNTGEDKRGLVNRIFSGLSPILAKSKSLKQTNRPLYLLLKYTVNARLMALVGFIIYSVVSFLASLA